MEESPVMCAKGCGFFGNSAFRGMCSKCFKASFKEEAKNVAEKATKKKQTLEQRTPDKDSASQDVKELTSTFTEMLQSGLADDKTRKESRLQAPDVDDGDSMKEGAAAGPGPAKHGCEARVSEVPTGAVSAQKEGEKKRKSPRCVSCRKKVGLTGFTCRCGGLFCGLHRYSDVHQCPFDYKKLAQEELRKANPLIAAAKVDKL